MKKVLFVFMALSLTVSAVEIIEIKADLSDEKQKWLWPELSNGGIAIDAEHVFIADQNRLHVLDREESTLLTVYEPKIGDSRNFFIRKVAVSEGAFAFSLLLFDGRGYIYREARKQGLHVGPVGKHSYSESLFWLKDGRLVASSIYRPEFTNYLDKYDDESESRDDDKVDDIFRKFYETHKGFTVSVFDQKLKLIDSANVINRRGSDAECFTVLAAKQPFDVTADNEYILIDGDQGYSLEKYDSLFRQTDVFEIDNENFKAIPKHLTKAKLQELQYGAGSYSVPYFLAAVGGRYFVSFYGNVPPRDMPEPPYFYDIMDSKGQQIQSGSLNFPVMSKSTDDVLFILVRYEEGWFSNDTLYLVGLTLEEIMAGKAEQPMIEKLIRSYREG